MHRRKTGFEKSAEDIEAELRAKADKPRTIEIDPALGPKTIDRLNQTTLFQGRIKFVALQRTGSIVQADFADGRKAHWRTATDLRTFSRTQDILLEATGFLIPTPAGKAIRRTWEPIAQLIRDIADQNATDTEPPLEDEFRQIIRSTWERAGMPEVTKEEFNQILQLCQLHFRDPHADPPRCCVWIAEGWCWIHQPSLVEWLSATVAKSKHYPFDDVRAALHLLGFRPKDVCRSVEGKGIHVRVWRGPLDVLVDDETRPFDDENAPFEP